MYPTGGTRYPGIYSSCAHYWGQKWHVGTNEDKVDETKWLRWLRAVTHEETVRGIARAANVSHTTVQRWVQKGVPPQTVWDLTIQFRGDPIAALVVLGRVTVHQVADLNFGAILPYVPEETLTSELHRRALERRHVTTRVPGVPLGRSDNLSRTQMRLTAKQ